MGEYATASRWRDLCLALQERAGAAGVPIQGGALPPDPCGAASLRAFSEALEGVAQSGGWFDKRGYDAELASCGASDGRLHASASDFEISAWEYPDDPAPKVSSREFGIGAIRNGLVSAQFRPDHMGTGSLEAGTYMDYAEELLRSMRHILVPVSQGGTVSARKFGGPAGDEAYRVAGMTLDGEPSAPLYLPTWECAGFSDWAASPGEAGERYGLPYASLGRDLPADAPQGLGYAVRYGLGLVQRVGVAWADYGPPLWATEPWAFGYRWEDGWILFTLEGVNEYWTQDELDQVVAAWNQWPQNDSITRSSDGHIGVVSSDAVELGPSAAQFAAPCAGTLHLHLCKPGLTRHTRGWDGRYVVGKYKDFVDDPEHYTDDAYDYYVLSPDSEGMDREDVVFDGGDGWTMGWNARLVAAPGVHLVGLPRAPSIAPGQRWYTAPQDNWVVDSESDLPSAFYTDGRRGLAVGIEYTAQDGYTPPRFTGNGPHSGETILPNPQMHYTGDFNRVVYPAGSLLCGCAVDLILFEPAFEHLVPA